MGSLAVQMSLLLFFVAQIGTWDSEQGLEISRPLVQAKSDETQAANRTLIVTTIEVYRRTVFQRTTVHA